jgi:hypothetical protein
MLTTYEASVDGGNVYAKATNTDFKNGGVISFNFSDYYDDSPDFVGEIADLAELRAFDVGYIHDGQDTLVITKLPEIGADEDQTYKQITLSEFNGTLTASDFDFA